MNRRLIAALLLSATTFASLPACSMQPDKQEPKAEATTPAGTEIGIDLAGMDTKVNPGDNFYDYANGTWQKTAKISQLVPSGRAVSMTARPPFRPFCTKFAKKSLSRTKNKEVGFSRDSLLL